MRSTVGMTVRGHWSVARLRVFTGMLLAVFIAACGGGGSSSPSTAESTPVSISSLSPASALAGGAAFVLTVNGSGFVSGSVAQWNGQTLPTQSVSATSLTATISAADIAAVGSASITVSNASAGGAGSSVVSFAINEGPSPALTSLAPAAAAVGSGSLTLVVTGKNFTSQSTVLWNGKPQPTVYDSSTQLSVSIVATALSSVSTVAVTVMNDAAEGGTSNTATFSIQAVLPGPTLTSITPTSIPSGTTNVTLTATGTNFTKTSLIYIDGNAVPTKYVSAAMLTATVPSTYLAQQADVSISVADVASGDVPTSAQTLSVPPVLKSLSPSSISAGSSGFTLTVNGVQLSATTVVYWNGTALATTFQNTSTLVAQVPSRDVASPSTVTVTLEDPVSGDTPTNPAAFNILPPEPTLTSTTPNSIPSGTTNVTLTATGTNFTKTSLIYLDGNAILTEYASATTLTATVPNAYLAQQGKISITVADVASGGVPTSAQTLSVPPVLKFLSPSSISAGSAGFTLTVNGVQLSATTVVYWNGTALATTFQNTSTLVAQVPSQDVVSPSTVTVTLEDPVSGDTPTNPAAFNILPPEPTLKSITPNSIPSGTTNVTLTATGTNFTKTSLIYIDGNAVPTKYVSATTLTAAVPSTYLAQQGEVSISVADVASGDVPTGAQTLSVPPILKSLSQSSISAGSAGFTLTVAGAQLSATTVVYWNGTALATTFQNTSTLVAQVPSQDVVSPSTVTVTLEDPVSGDAPSNGLPFTVQAKVVLSYISPTSVVTGGTAFTLTAQGSGFVAASVVTLGGTSLPTTYVSSTVLTTKVSAAQIASAGSPQVSVVNPANAGGTSGTLPLAVGAASKDAVSIQISAAHTGAIAFNSVTLPASSAWTVDLGGEPSYAVIVGGTVFVTVGVDNNSQLVALSGATGAKLWGPIAIAGGSNAAYDNGALFVLSSVFGSSGLMQAFDPSTGQSLWSTALTGQYEFVSPPVAAQGIVATQGAGDGSTIYALNESNGAIAWTQNVDAGGFGTIALSVDGVYESQPCQTFDFALPTGLAVWQQNTGCDGGGGATPVVANGSVYSPIDTGYDGTIYAAETGAVLGSFAADVPPAITPTAAYMLQSQTLRSIAVSNNQVNWSFAGDGALVTSPIVVNNYVFVGSSKGNLYAVDATTGAQVWTKSLGSAVPASPGYAPHLPYTGLAAGDGLLVVPNGTSVTAFLLSSSP